MDMVCHPNMIIDEYISITHQGRFGESVTSLEKLRWMNIRKINVSKLDLGNVRGGELNEEDNEEVLQFLLNLKEKKSTHSVHFSAVSIRNLLTAEFLADMLSEFPLHTLTIIINYNSGFSTDFISLIRPSMWRKLQILSVVDCHSVNKFITAAALSHICVHSTKLTECILYNGISMQCQDLSCLLRNNEKTLLTLHARVKVDSFKVLLEEFQLYCSAKDVLLETDCVDELIDFDYLWAYISKNLDAERIVLFDHPFERNASVGFEMSFDIQLDRKTIRMLNVLASQSLLITMLQTVTGITWCEFIRVTGINSSVIKSITDSHCLSLRRFVLHNCGSNYTLQDILGLCEACTLLDYLEIDEDCLLNGSKKSFEHFRNKSIYRRIRVVFK
jgi:hypothetical protein